MLCLSCKQREGTYSWDLTPSDFGRLLGEERKPILVDDCFCESCIYLSLNQLDNALFEYLKTLQQPTKQKSHYYKWHPAIECIKVTEQFASNLGQAIQYIWRSETLNPNAVTKGQTTEDVIKDLEKAQAFIQYEIDRLRGN